MLPTVYLRLKQNRYSRLAVSIAGDLAEAGILRDGQACRSGDRRQTYRGGCRDRSGRNGADIALCYNRSKTEADETADAIKALGRRVFVKQANLSQARDCETFINESAAVLGRLDVLVNMASVYVKIPFDELTVEQFDANLNVDLRAAFICARAVVPHLVKAGGGHIINFSTGCAQRPPAL